MPNQQAKKMKRAIAFPGKDIVNPIMMVFWKNTSESC